VTTMMFVVFISCHMEAVVFNRSQIGFHGSCDPLP
jgi:hypothetical protein